MDRFVCNESWHNLFPMSVTENYAFFGSDHRLISLGIHDIIINNLVGYPKRFYFEQKWLLENDFADCVATGWTGSILNPNLPAQLTLCSQEMKNWAGERFNRLGKKIQRKRNEMEYFWKSIIVKDNFD